MSDFSLWIRRDAGYDLRVSIRFLVTGGAGVLSVPKRGRPDAPPTTNHEEGDLDVDAVRGGRFIHITEEGQRRVSYALARVGADRVARLTADQWVKLEPVTEFGFRYAVIPDGVGAEAGPGPVAVAVAAAPGAGPAMVESVSNSGRVPAVSASAGLDPLTNSGRVPAAASAATSSRLAAARAGASMSAPPTPPGGTPALGTPSGGTPSGGSASGLLARARQANAAMQAARPAAEPPPRAEPEWEEPITIKPVPRPEPVRDPRIEAAAERVPVAASEGNERVEALIVKVAELERRLAESKAREADLMQLLNKWQARG